MVITIDRNSGIPFYIQIKNQIMNNIRKGNIKVGDKLPTERQLANELNISRNTISSAYNLLEQEGALISYQGRGTFVAEEAGIWKRHAVQEKVLRIVDLAIDEALGSGLSSEELIDIINDRIIEKESMIKNINAIFVECNIEQAQVFSEHLNEITNLHVTPIVLSQLYNKDENIENILNNTQFVIVTYKHINETKLLLKDYNLEIVGAAINPNFETIVKVAKYPEGTKFGLVSQSDEFLKKVEDALKISGIVGMEIFHTTTEDEKELNEFINKVDAVIISPGRGNKIQKIVQDKKEIINFVYLLDEESIKIIKSKLMNIK